MLHLTNVLFGPSYNKDPSGQNTVPKPLLKPYTYNELKGLLYPSEHQRALYELVSKESVHSGSNWNLKVLVFVEGGKLENLEKNPRSKDENQQQTSFYEMLNLWNELTLSEIKRVWHQMTSFFLPFCCHW